MFNWQSVDITYLYDGTFEGLLTLVFDLFTQKIIPIKIENINVYTTNLLDNTCIVVTDYTKFDRVYKGIANSISYDTLYICYNAFLSNENTKELAIVKYIIHGFIIGPKINTMLHLDYVFYTQALKKKVLGEAHRLKGLVRFQETKNNLFYACIHPDNNVIEKVGQHFINRLPMQNFIIHDKNRDIAFLYNTKKYEIIEVNNFTFPGISSQEQKYQELWKAFFKTISIKERVNPKLQLNYMPKRYWRDLIEME